MAAWPDVRRGSTASRLSSVRWRTERTSIIEQTGSYSVTQVLGLTCAVMNNPPPPPGHAVSAQADPTGSPLGAADGDRSPRMRILVVDDLVDAAESLALLLHAIG